MVLLSSVPTLGLFNETASGKSDHTGVHDMNVTPFIAGYFVLMGVWVLTRNMRVHHWPYVAGKMVAAHTGTGHKPVENFTTRDRVFDRTITNWVEYEYSVDGVTYAGTRVSFTQIRGNLAAKPLLKRQMNRISWLENGDVKVFYNPAKPHQSVLIKPKKINYIAGLAAILIGLAVALHGLIAI